MSEELVAEILDITNNSNLCPGRYLVPRLNLVFGKPLRHGPWSRELFPRLLVRGENGEIPEEVRGQLTAPILRLHPDNPWDWFKRIPSGTDFVAQRVYNGKSQLHPLRNVWTRVRSGHLRNGWRGLFTLIYAFAWETAVAIKMNRARGNSKNIDETQIMTKGTSHNA